MRKLPKVVIGAMLLPVGLLPAMTGASTASASVAVAGAAAQEEPPPAQEEPPPAEEEPPPPAEEEPPPAEEEPPPAEEEPPPGEEEPPGEDFPEIPDEEFPDLELGEFKTKPAYGKAGTTVSLQSVTPCKVDGEVLPDVEVLLFSADALMDIDAEPVVDKILKTDAKGAWKTTVKIPASAKVGEFFFIEAACFGDLTEEDFPFVLYNFEQFAVTGAEEAPVANPVPRDPNFTG